MNDQVLRGEDVTRWFFDPKTRRGLRDLAGALRAYPTKEALESAPQGPVLRAKAWRMLGTIHAGAAGEGPLETYRQPASAGPASKRSELRLVHWNILKGICLDGIVRALREHPDLAAADIISLNEVDAGMARSGNRHIAAELGAALGMHWIWQPCYLELTKGLGSDADAPGENEIGLQGMAILSRNEPLGAHGAWLPECFDTFSFAEKRFGARAGLFVSLPGGIIAGTTHLEVRSTSRCRAAQMRAFLAAGEACAAAEKEEARAPKMIIVSGDLNTHTFGRGSLWHAMRGGLRIYFTTANALRAQLMEPWRGRREPLFDELRRSGYRWRELNDSAPTATELLGRVEEWSILPRDLGFLLMRVLGFAGRELPLRLDWFAARGGPAAPDAASPRTVIDLRRENEPSDHNPVSLTLRMN